VKLYICTFAFVYFVVLQPKQWKNMYIDLLNVTLQPKHWEKGTFIYSMPFYNLKRKEEEMKSFIWYSIQTQINI